MKKYFFFQVSMGTFYAGILRLLCNRGQDSRYLRQQFWMFTSVSATYSYMIFFGSLKKLALAEFFETELLENVTEPSRAFWPKARAKSEPSLGSGATLETPHCSLWNYVYWRQPSSPSWLFLNVVLFEFELSFSFTFEKNWPVLTYLLCAHPIFDTFLWNCLCYVHSGKLILVR